MPEIRHYTVEQTRFVEVAANTAADAALIASRAFSYGQNSDNGLVRDASPLGVWGNTTSRIRETRLDVKEREFG